MVNTVEKFIKIVKVNKTSPADDPQQLRDILTKLNTSIENLEKRLQYVTQERDLLGSLNFRCNQTNYVQYENLQFLSNAVNDLQLSLVNKAQQNQFLLLQVENLFARLETIENKVGGNKTESQLCEEPNKYKFVALDAVSQMNLDIYGWKNLEVTKIFLKTQHDDTRA